VPPDDQRKRHLAGPVASGAKARRRRVRAPDRRELEHRLRLRRRRQRSRRASPASRGGPPACSRPPSAAWSSFGRLTGPGSMPRCSGPAVARTADRCSPRGPAAAPRCPRPGDGRAARGRPCPRRAPWSVNCSVVSDVRSSPQSGAIGHRPNARPGVGQPSCLLGRGRHVGLLRLAHGHDERACVRPRARPCGVPRHGLLSVKVGHDERRRRQRGRSAPTDSPAAVVHCAPLAGAPPPAGGTFPGGARRRVSHNTPLR
jgi:hypothetical protein